MIRASINGFGRIGRLVLRAHLERPSDRFDIVAINDLMPIQQAAHLLQYDSVHGFLPNVTHNNEYIIVGRKKIRFLQERNPLNLPWSSLGVDFVAECTGIFNTKEKASVHIHQGASRVLISAPCSDADIMVVYGINHDSITQDHTILSNASCTTNALAPIIQVLQKNMPIKNGFLTTTHAFTADQKLVDAPHKDLRRARAASESIIPTSTGAARSIGVIFPELMGRLDGISVRVPTTNVSFIDLSLNLEKRTTAEDVITLLRQYAQKDLAGIMRISDQPLVSRDFLHAPESVVIDSLMTQVIDHTLLKIFAWYDNEWGFSNRMCDVLSYMQRIL